MNRMNDLIQNGFSKIIRPSDITARKPLHGKWDPYLSNFFLSVSVRIRNQTKFYPDLIDLNKVDVKNTTIYSELNLRTKMDKKSSASVLIGRVGTGKTSFLKWFRKNAEKKLIFVARVDYNLYPTPEKKEKKIKNSQKLFDEVIEDALQRFCEYFTSRLQYEKGFKRIFQSKIRAIKENLLVKNYENWETGFVSQSSQFLKDFPNYNRIWLLTVLINSANECFGTPIWMIFDNIDRLPPIYQKIVVQISHNIFDRVLEISRGNKWYARFHLITTARPETIKLNDFDFEQFRTIKYPSPRIIKIASKRLFESLHEVAEEQGPLEASVILGGKKYNHTSEIAQHIEKSIRIVFKSFNFIANLPVRKLKSDSWHLDLVNNNIRRFIRPWAVMILSGNFINDLIFPENDDQDDKEFSVHRYIKLLIKGKFDYFIGNEKINGYGFNEESPLFFNMFGFPRVPGTTNFKYSENYLVFIRIIQYLLGHEHGNGIRFATFHKELSKFFNSKLVRDATKILLWTRVIDEVSTGARDIGPSANCKAIVLKRESALVATNTTKLYLHTLLSEYDYISSMAMVSYQLSTIQKQRINFDSKIESVVIGEATLYFLESWLEIALSNYNSYNIKGNLEKFVELFLKKKNTGMPWQKAISKCILVLENKLNHALKLGCDEKAEAFKSILNRMNKLKVRGIVDIGNQLGERCTLNFEDIHN